MKHKIFLVATIMMALMVPQEVSAYDFSAVAPTGQTLYYDIVGNNVTVNRQNFYSPYYSIYPSGSLEIPASVTYNGTTYTVTMIGFGAFDDCSGLTSVTIPNSIISIDDYAFRNCSGLSSITIPSSVTTIGDDAFYNCTGLTSLTIPNAVTSIGGYAFYNCRSLTSIVVESGNTAYDSRQNCNAIIETATNTLLTGCMNTIIPNTVTAIGPSAFNYCSGLASVTIPNSVTSIGFAAFGHCNGLTSVTIPNSVTSIGDYAFQFCSSLTSVILPNGITSISNSIFYNCSSLTAITIPNGVTSIGASAFFGCSNLTTITVPNSVTSIDNFAFCNCSGLLSITLPDSITLINEAIFRNCSSLSSIIIPKNVTLIDWQAFKNCSSLDSVYMMPSEAPSLGSEAFYNNAPGRVFVLSGCSSDSYYNNPSWSSFHNYFREGIIDINLYLSVNDYSFGTVNVIPGPGNRNIRCDSSVVIQATNYYGYFDHWSTGSTANPDTIYLVGDSTVTAYFTGLTVTSSDNERGTASHLKIGDHIDKIIATANYGYHFDHWSNGSTANPDTIQFIGDSTVIAFFERNTYHLTAEANDASLGSLLMPFGDSALYQDTLMVVATPNEHYHVGSWYGMDIVGISTNKDTVWVKMTRNSFVTCNFEINTYTVNVVSNNIIRGMVESNGTQFAYGTPCTVTATAYTGYTFAGWSNGVTANPYTFAVVCDVELTALFVADGEEVFTVTVESADPTMGTVDGGGQALSGGTLTIRAIPNEGYRFLHWNDDNTDNPRVVTVTENVTYTAYFESTTQGIHEADNNTITIYPNPTNGIVKIASDDVTRIDVYNVNGQLVKSVSKYSVIDISNLPSGVYTLRVVTVQSTFVCRVIKQ